MSRYNFFMTLIAIASLPFSQLLITKLQLGDVGIALYWLGLGLLCAFIFVKSRNIVPKSISLRGTQLLNFMLGGFGLVTSSLVGLSYIL
ncbi:MAG: hypothetical protein QF441_12885 [Bacteriovoracaceae bacterium]|jgi:hypothetical protein|nr:hypothetical protein [Halobacteriovoraceae bacterium]MDP7321499.1 hypothetical protein [Bacteriovoracaceae bacterium]